MDSTQRNRKIDLERKAWNPADSYGNQQICLSMSLEEHQKFSTDNEFAKSTIRCVLQETPELLPQAVRNHGFWLDGHERQSTRLPDIRLRRIRVPGTNTVFTIRPSAVLPSMVGFTDEVEPVGPCSASRSSSSRSLDECGIPSSRLVAALELSSVQRASPVTFRSHLAQCRRTSQPEDLP